VNVNILFSLSFRVVDGGVITRMNSTGIGMHTSAVMIKGRPAEDQYWISDVKIILDIINDPQIDFFMISQLACDLVKEKALELGKRDWLADPWGRPSTLQARRECIRK
jgi:hypothetical protein